MVRALLVGVLLSTAFLAGCVTDGGLLSPQVSAPPLDLVPTVESLWPDHRNAPHPAFGWPTLTHPATGANVPTWWAPIPPATVPDAIKGLELVSKSPEQVKSGGGIALFGSLAIVPGLGLPSSFVDISDPTAPKLLSSTAEDQKGHRGAAVMAFPNGTLLAVFSTSKGFDVFDITDPMTPTFLSNVTPKTGGHKIGVVPGTPYVYNANSKGGGAAQDAADPKTAKGQTEIYDLTDPSNPLLVQEFKNGYGCHHIYFWIDGEKQRATCAGIQMTQIWDIADPAAPKVIVNVPVHHGNPALPPAAIIGAGVGAMMFSHFAILNEKGTVLIVGDEFRGGGSAECDGIHTPVKDAAGPFGNLWFYDVKDEKAPKMLGWFSPPPQTTTDPNPPNPANPTSMPGCTAHHGRLVPTTDGKQELLAMAWYGAGVVLVDFTDPSNPRMVDEWNPGTNTWEVWYYNGYIFTGDIARGLDILKLK